MIFFPFCPGWGALLYADQRYFNYGYGRFRTPDPAGIGVFVFGTWLGGGLIAAGASQIIIGFVGTNQWPPAASALTAGAPGSVIAAAASGGNPTATQVGSQINATVANVIFLGTANSMTDVSAFAVGAIAPVVDDAPTQASSGQSATQANSGQSVIVNPVPTVVDVSGSSAPVDPVYAPISDTLGGSGGVDYGASSDVSGDVIN